MHAKRPLSRDYFGFFVLTIVAASVTTLMHKSPAGAQDKLSLDRAQTLIVNLNKVQGCAGWYLLQDIRQAKLMEHDLLKAHGQVEGADRQYARSRGLPDDKFMAPVIVKLEKVQADRAQLEEDLHDCFDQLRTSINDVVLADRAPSKKEQDSSSKKRK